MINVQRKQTLVALRWIRRVGSFGGGNRRAPSVNWSGSAQLGGGAATTSFSADSLSRQ
jgi:hypothetical protein